MTAIASRRADAQPASPRASVSPNYRHAHWYLLGALLVMVAGFWPTFFRPIGSGSPVRDAHGISAILWYVLLPLQSWLVARGERRWHRRVAWSVVLLFPLLCVTALMNTSAMLTSSIIPPPVRPIIAFIDWQLILQMTVLLLLGVRYRRVPAAHKRFMAATVLPGFGPALARLYQNLGIDQLGPIHGPSLTVNAILITMIISDWRNGERHLAYPLLLVWTFTVQLLIRPLSASSWWLAFCQWFAAAPAV